MNKPALFAALFALGVIWGCTIPLTKIAVSTGHHPFGLIFWQFSLSAIVLFFVVLVRRSRLIIDPKHLLFFLVIACLGTLIPNSMSLMAAAQLPGGVMALIIALVPLFSLLVALSIGRETFAPIRFLGVLLGVGAMALIALPETSLPDPSKAIFVLIGLIAPLCYGIEGNYLSVKQPEDTGPIAAMFGASVIGTILVLPLVMVTGTFINPLDGMGAPEFAQMCSSLLHVVAYTGYIWMVGKAGAVFASQVGYIVTPAGVILSILVLNETQSHYVWIALVVVLVAITLVQPKKTAQDAGSTQSH